MFTGREAGKGREGTDHLCVSHYGARGGLLMEHEAAFSRVRNASVERV